MILSGKIWKDDKIWLIEVPSLDVMTQGHTKKEAYEMIVDAIELLIDEKTIKVKVNPVEMDKFTVEANDEKQLTALMLKRQRVKSRLTIDQLSQRLGYRSKNAYAQYEQAKSLPSMTKIQEFLSAMNKKILLTCNIVET
jgi:predicted RNase H-like HicB family nuclease